jgi:hypothetical protein
VHALARLSRQVKARARVPGLTVAAAASVLTLLLNDEML